MAWLDRSRISRLVFTTANYPSSEGAGLLRCVQQGRPTERCPTGKIFANRAKVTTSSSTAASTLSAVDALNRVDATQEQTPDQVKQWLEDEGPKLTDPVKDPVPAETHHP